MDNQTISLVLPTKNSQRLLNETIDSLMAQQFSSFELIVCDSDSSDRTLELLENRMPGKYKIASRTDDSVPDALNKGFSVASGGILGWINSDDVLCGSSALNLVHNTFTEDNCDVLIGDFVTMNEDGIVRKTHVSYPPISHNPLSAGNVFTGSLFFSRESWSEFGGFSCKYRYAFEYELMDFLFARFPVKKINRIIAGFRVHDEGLSSKYSDRMAGELILLRGQGKDVTPWLSLKSDLRRVRSILTNECFFRTIKNYFYDKCANLHWKYIAN